MNLHMKFIRMTYIQFKGTKREINLSLWLQIYRIKNVLMQTTYNTSPNKTFSSWGNHAFFAKILPKYYCYIDIMGVLIKLTTYAIYGRYSVWHMTYSLRFSTLVSKSGECRYDYMFPWVHGFTPCSLFFWGYVHIRIEYLGYARQYFNSTVRMSS